MQITNFRQNKTTSRFSLISAFLILLLFITPLTAFAKDPVLQQVTKGRPTQDTASIDTLRQMGKAFAKIAEEASPAVVGLRVEKTATQDYPTVRDWPFGDPFDDDLFDFFFRRRSPQQRSPRQRSPRQRPRQIAQGSGFIISADGYILTNNHLVSDAEKVTVNLADGRELEAKIIGTDPDSDVAVIKLDAKDLPVLELADSDSLEVGEWVIAIGNPFGLSHTVTAGIVSAKGRSGFRIAEYEDFIQTDAAINPGNSGGPLLNLNGKAVGINTAIIGSRGNIGIGLAIPVNMAKAIYDQLVEGGTVVRGFLGVGIQDLTAELAESFDLKDTKGVLISEVTEDSAAEKAGLKQGDIVVEFEGQAVEKMGEFRNRVAMLKPGTKVKIVVLRDGKRKELTAKLSERPVDERVAAGETEMMETLGFAVQELTDDLAKRFGYEGLRGVIVTEVEPGSLAEFAGIGPGTLIMEVNRTQVSNVKEFNEEIEKGAGEGSVLLLVRDERYSRYVLLKLPKSK